MKIAHVSTATNWRGGEQQCLYLMSGLRDRGVDQVLFAPPEAPLTGRAREAGIPVEALTVRGGGDLPAFWRLRRRVKSFPVDLIHAHDGHAATAAAVAGWRTKIARVATRRTCFPLRSRWKYGKGFDRLICISEAVRQVCLEAGIPEAKLAVVRSGVDPERLPAERSMRSLREELGIDRRENVLLNVAALTEEKDHRSLLEAMLCIARDAPGTHLLIAGDGPLADELGHQCRELALDHCVHFLGFRDDVGSLLQLCDLFVMASRAEGLGTSVLDAMAHERACVVSRAGGLPEVVLDGETGRVVPVGEPEALAEAVTDLLGDRKRRERMARAGRRRILEHFNADEMVDGTIAVYRELLQDGKRS
jgi:glycosyltransferase involved in cell wall biosynthesis